MLTKSMNFNPYITKTNFDLPCKDDYKASQFCSVSMRLNFEYKNCIDSNGLCYFVTFTYNDTGITNFLGRNVFKNYDIRNFCNKSIFPSYLSSHGYTFKFAFFGELGDGKGKRGVHNNPHYHALFFLYPLSTCDYYYSSDKKFLQLCLSAWNHENTLLGSDYISLPVGNVSFSKKGALVSDIKVFSYCSLYCIKSDFVSDYSNFLQANIFKSVFISLFNNHFNSYDDLFPEYNTDLIFDSEFIKRFFIQHSYLNDYYGDLIDLNSPCLSLFAIYDREMSSVFSLCDLSPLFPELILNSTEDFVFSSFYKSIIRTPLFQSLYRYFYNSMRCKYQLSMELGACGLDYIDKDTFKLNVSCFPQLKRNLVNLPSYYYRKLLFDYLPEHQIYVKNNYYDKYIKLNYTKDKYYSELYRFRSCYHDFRLFVPLHLRSSLDAIPFNIFVSFIPFYSMLFDSSDIPIIEESDPYSYLMKLSFSFNPIYYSSVPLSVYNFRNRKFIPFEFHPVFQKYDNLSYLVYLYKSFKRFHRSSEFVGDKLLFKELYSLLNNSNYEIV